MRTINVFLFVRSVYPRDYTGSHDPRPPRFVASWIARGTSHEMYRSSSRATEADAVRLAQAWLAKHPEHRDTTTTKRAT